MFRGEGFGGVFYYRLSCLELVLLYVKVLSDSEVWVSEVWKLLVFLEWKMESYLDRTITF